MRGDHTQLGSRNPSWMWFPQVLTWDFGNLRRYNEPKNRYLYKSISLSLEHEMPMCVGPSSVIFRQIPNLMLESCEQLEMDLRPALVYVESEEILFLLVRIDFREAE